MTIVTGIGIMTTIMIAATVMTMTEASIAAIGGGDPSLSFGCGALKM